MGRIALPVFALGTILSFAVRSFKAVTDAGLPLDSLYIGGGILCMWSFAWVLEKSRAVTRAAGSAAALSQTVRQ